MPRRFHDILAIGIIVSLTGFVRADVMPIPAEILIDQADLIVAGKVTKIEPKVFTQKFGDQERIWDAAVVEVADVLKGSDKTKEVKIAQPAKGGIATSRDRRFEVGNEYVWMLKFDKEKGVYNNWHPGEVLPIKNKDEIAKQVKARSELPGGKAVNGLVARAELLARGNQQEIRFSLKNTSDKPITICDYAGNRPLEVAWIGPDGKDRKSSHYDWLAAAFLAPLSDRNFVTIQPGAVLFLGPQSPWAGIVFPKLEAGEHKITVGYTNKETGEKLNKKDVWTGTVTANEIKIAAK